MASKYVAMDSQRREVPVKPYARICITSARLGFVHAPYYTVSMDWLSMSGEFLGGGIPDYSGFGLAKAKAVQQQIAAEQRCETATVI